MDQLHLDLEQLDLKTVCKIQLLEGNSLPWVQMIELITKYEQNNFNYFVNAVLHKCRSAISGCKLRYQ